MKGRSVADRVDALKRFTAATTGYLPDRDIALARALVERAGERLALSREHTVVALAGATGTGKSSIFNQMAGLDLSPTGVRRPTTGETHACVWGADNTPSTDATGGTDSTDSTDALLNWLGVRRRFYRDINDGPELSGLVLLDLPDFDSVERAHRAEADRLLSIVDQVVWVLHPQKYADKVVHKNYLARFHHHRDITVVVLNQVDLLSTPDLNECVTDLRHLLKKDGLDDVPVLTASTVAPPGLDALTTTLAKAVAARQAALRRLAADVDEITIALEPTVHTGKGGSVGLDKAQPGTAGPGSAGFRGTGLDKAGRAALTDALGRAAGVPTVVDATRRAYIHRARKVTGWPLLRWLRRMRPDPLRRLHLGDHAAETTAATSIGPAAPAAQAGVALALRDTATRASTGLPESWHAPVLTAARSNLDDLPDALDRAVAQTDLGLTRPRWWWRLIGALQWLFTAIAAAGLLWLGVRYVMFALALPEFPVPQVGRLPLPTALFLGGLLAGLLLSLFSRPLVRFAATRHARRIHRRLRTAIDHIAHAMVLTPTERVLTAYAEARAALSQARR